MIGGGGGWTDGEIERGIQAELICLLFLASISDTLKLNVTQKLKLVTINSYCLKKVTSYSHYSHFPGKVTSSRYSVTLLRNKTSPPIPYNLQNGEKGEKTKKTRNMEKIEQNMAAAGCQFF